MAHRERSRSRASGHTLDPREFDGERWWDVGEFALPDADPHFGRFLTKLDTALRLTAD